MTLSETYGVPTTLQIAILRSKASGKSDIAAARELHISERTLRRNLGELAQCLGVAGRLALGIEVGRRGWLAGHSPHPMRDLLVPARGGPAPAPHDTG